MSVTSVGYPTRVPISSPISAAHTSVITAACLGVASFGVAAVSLPTAALAVILALAVVVVGLPHGGLDHRTGRSLLARRFGSWWALLFLAGYLAVAACVLVAWTVTPVATIVVFFTLSAAHFGDTELGPRWRATLFGGLPIWVPLLSQPAATLTLLAWVTPGGVNLAEQLASVRPLLIGLAVASAFVWVVGAVNALRCRDRDALLDALRLAATTLMLAFAPVLVGFGVCFCGWHSLRELGRLAARAEPLDPVAGFRRVTLAAAPLALIAAGMAAAAAWFLSDGREVGPVVVQAVFLGLSAVAVPHILLHAVAGWAGADSLLPPPREVPG